MLFTALPWATGNPVYTYASLGLGVMGWFGVANAQSAIIVLVMPLAIFFAWKTGKYLVFLLSLVLSFGLMFITGTKFTFYSIFIIAGAYVFLFVLHYKKQCLRYVVPLLGVVVLVVAFRSYAPMMQRESQSQYALNNYQNLVEESLKNSGTDQIRQELEESGKEGGSSQEGPTEGEDVWLKRLRDSLMGVYTDPEVYGPVFGNMYDRFGVYNVMDAYNYTSEPSVLSDSRVRKSMYAKLMWEEKDFLTRLLGFEYSDMIYGDTIYDLENDFPAVFYFCGYIGFLGLWPRCGRRLARPEGQGPPQAGAGPVRLWGRGAAVPHGGDGRRGHDLPAGGHRGADFRQRAAPAQRDRLLRHRRGVPVLFDRHPAAAARQGKVNIPPYPGNGERGEPRAAAGSRRPFFAGI